MSITKFTFKDHFREWTLSETSFSDFNLMIGHSGVGKTRILKALYSVLSIGSGRKRSLSGCEWHLEVTTENNDYIWQAKTSIPDTLPVNWSEDDSETKSGDYPQPSFIFESIVRNQKDKLIDRDATKFVFNNERLPKLTPAISAISLLWNEESITPLRDALRRNIFSQAVYQLPRSLRVDEVKLQSVRGKYRSLEALKKALDVHILLKAYLLQEDYIESFEEIKQHFIEIFDTVLDIKIGSLTEFEPLIINKSSPNNERLVFAIKEEGISGWLVHPRLSSGMWRTLLHLFEIALAPPDTLVVVDEFENSLGVNCLPQLTDYFLRHTDLQFILTSHHPYIINNVPWRYWKLVTRQGSEVAVKDATSIPALSEASSLERFTQLLNLEEFEEAVQGTCTSTLKADERSQKSIVHGWDMSSLN